MKGGRMMSQYHIMMILVNHRTDSAKQVQTLLTKHGCSIKTRIGLHETDQSCANDGLVILQLSEEPEDIKKLMDELNGLKDIKTEYIRMEN